MTALTLAAVLQAAILTTGADTYADAHRAASTDGRPLVVLVGAEWCPACRTMKEGVIPQAKQQGLLDQVAFAYVNTDREPKIARQLMKGGAIPQLVVYHKNGDRWTRTGLVGAQSLQTIESLVERALQDDPQLSQR